MVEIVGQQKERGGQSGWLRIKISIGRYNVVILYAPQARRRLNVILNKSTLK
jgi:hypothetical protein